MTAEYRVKTEGRGRVLDEWKMRSEKSKNHWLDGLVGCAVAASGVGVHLAETDIWAMQKREPIKLSALRQGKR